MIDIKCLSCGKILFKATVLDDQGNLAMDPKHKLSLTQKDGETYFKCPHCDIKNIVVETTSSSGLLKLKIVNAKK